MTRHKERGDQHSPMPSADHLSQLYRTMDLARPLEDKQRLAKEIVDYAMRDNYDCLTVLHTLDHAYRAMNPLTNTKDRRGGFLVLKGIEEYYTEVKINFKRLFPSVQGWQREKKEADTLVSSIKRNRDVVQKLPWFKDMYHGAAPDLVSDDLVNGVERNLADLTQEPKLTPIIESVADMMLNMIKDPDSFLFEKELFFKLLSEATHLQAFTIEQNQAIRNNVLKSLKALEARKFKFLLHPYTQKFGPEGHQVSLKDIDEFELGKIRIKKLKDTGKIEDTRRIDRLGKMVLRYIASVPPGDVVWQNLISALLMYPSYGDETDEFAKKIFLVQKWLGEKLLLSALSHNIPDLAFAGRFRPVLERDPEFDSLFAQALGNLDEFSIGFLALTEYMASANAVYAINKLFGIPIDRAIRYCPIPSVSLPKAYKTKGKQFVNMTREVRKLYSRSWSFIFSDMGERFAHLADRKRLDLFKAALIHIVGEDYDKTIARSLIKHIDTNLGGIYRERLDKKAGQLARINRQIVRDMKSVDSWPHSQTLHNVTYTSEEIPEIMGIEAVNFLTGADSSQPVSFHMILKDAGFSLSGTIEPDENIIWKIDIASVNPGIRRTLDYVVLASFHDLVVRHEAIFKERKRRGEVKVARRKSRLSSDSSEPGIRPRSRPIYVYGDDEPAEESVTISSHQLRREVETHRHVTPYHVGVKKMNLPGVAEYQKAYMEYKTSTRDERTVKYLALVEARKALHQPNPFKVENLPDRFHLDPLTDADTDEQLIDITREEDGVPPKKLYRNTWKTEYDVPPLNEAERENLDIRYFTRYRGGSALAFSDVLKAMILDIEGDEE